MLTSRQTTTALSLHTFFSVKFYKTGPTRISRLWTNTRQKIPIRLLGIFIEPSKKYRLSWIEEVPVVDTSLLDIRLEVCCLQHLYLHRVYWIFVRFSLALKHFSTHGHFSLIRYSINLYETKPVSQPAATGSYLWLMSASCSGTAIQKEGLCIEMKKVSRHD